jgi:nitrogen fixation protein NifU and related proteins
MSLLHTEALLDHFRNPRHAGVLGAPAIVVDVDNPACGDRLRLSAELDGGRIVRAAFQARGCTASMAAGSALAEWLHGRTPGEIAQLGPAGVAARVETLLGGLIPETRHASVLAADGALRLSAALTAPAS